MQIQERQLTMYLQVKYVNTITVETHLCGHLRSQTDCPDITEFPDKWVTFCWGLWIGSQTGVRISEAPLYIDVMEVATHHVLEGLVFHTEKDPSVFLKDSSLWYPTTQKKFETKRITRQYFIYQPYLLSWTRPSISMFLLQMRINPLYVQCTM